MTRYSVTVTNAAGTSGEVVEVEADSVEVAERIALEQTVAPLDTIEGVRRVAS